MWARAPACTIAVEVETTWQRESFVLNEESDPPPSPSTRLTKDLSNPCAATSAVIASPALSLSQEDSDKLRVLRQKAGVWCAPRSCLPARGRAAAAAKQWRLLRNNGLRLPPSSCRVVPFTRRWRENIARSAAVGITRCRS